MKFNWGWGIFTALGLFVLAMVYTIYLTMQNDYILESDDYYQQEIEYDRVIEATTLGTDLFPQTTWQKDSVGNVPLALPLVVDSAFCRLMHPETDQRDTSITVAIDGGNLILHFSELPAQNVLWRLELSAFVKGREALVRKRWMH
jgi:hypothetical protein